MPAPRVLGLCLSRTAGNFGWREWVVLPAGPERPDAGGRYVVKLPCALGDHYLALVDGPERVVSRQAPYAFPDRASAEAALEHYATLLGVTPDGHVEDPFFVHGSPISRPRRKDH